MKRMHLISSLERLLHLVMRKDRQLQVYEYTWGEYPWWVFTEDKENSVHPGDWDLVASPTQQRHYAGLAHCVATENDYLVVNYGKHRIRVRPDHFIVRPTPAFEIGDLVQENSGKQRTGHVRLIVWHYKRDCEYYLLNIGGHISTKWQFRDDLVLIKRNED